MRASQVLPSFSHDHHARRVCVALVHRRTDGRERGAHARDDVAGAGAAVLGVSYIIVTWLAPAPSSMGMAADNPSLSDPVQSSLAPSIVLW